MKLNLGCGRSPLEGWTNVDIAPLPGVDLVVDLDSGDLAKALEPDTVDASVGRHVLEHLRNPLAFMDALWTVTKHGGTATFEVPFGGSDDAWEDPTHVRPYFLGSWAYFGQPNYWRADYGYRADWVVELIEVFVPAAPWEGATDGDVYGAMMTSRNVVQHMIGTLRAHKPAREPLRDLQENTPVKIVRT